MLKQVFLDPLKPLVTRFGAWKILKCLENGTLWELNWVKNGSKAHFSTSDVGPFGMLKQVFSAHFEPVVTRFGPWKIPKCLENGPFSDQKWVKNGSKMGQKHIVPPVMLDHLGCSNKYFQYILSPW